MFGLLYFRSSEIGVPLCSTGTFFINESWYCTSQKLETPLLLKLAVCQVKILMLIVVITFSYVM